jgi:uncharacterized membrane protein
MKPPSLTGVAAVGAAVNAGVFFSWSAMVMPAIAELPTAEGVAAMQLLNEAAPGPFALVAFSTAALCVVVLIRALRSMRTRRATWMFGGALLFFLAAIVITFAANVPLSSSIDQLIPLDTTDQEWTGLQAGWVWANHLRRLGCLAAAVALMIAVFGRPAEPDLHRGA